MAEAKKAPPVGLVGEGPVPRVIHENERVSYTHVDKDGPAQTHRAPDPTLARFVVRAANADNGSSYPLAKYVLAKDRDSAVACYLEADREHIEAAGFDLKTLSKKTDGGRVVKLDVRVEKLPD